MKYKVEVNEIDDNNDLSELQLYDHEGNAFCIDGYNLVKLNQLLNCLKLYPDGMVKRLAKIYSK